MQRGQLFKRNGSWLLRHYDTVIRDGKTVRVRVAKRLASVEEYPTKSAVRLLADKHLAKINSGEVTPESSITVISFVEDVFFPAQLSRLKPSTIKDYKDIVRVHLKPRLGMRLRDFRTVHGQRIVQEICSGRPELSHQSLLRIKSFLSGVFTHAKIIGFLDGENPMVGVRVEGKRVKFTGKTYKSGEIWKMFLRQEDLSEYWTDDEGEDHPTDSKSANLPPVARMVIAVAALTGLRLGEIRGLRWEDFDGENLHVRRSVWRTRVGQPKTFDSEASVPVVPILREALVRFRSTTCKDAPDSAYIFRGEKKGAPLNLPNLARRVIIPAFSRAKIEWRGWHAFRRSTASLLFDLGAEPKIVQGILRRASVVTTMNLYVKPASNVPRELMTKLGNSILPMGLDADQE